MNTKDALKEQIRAAIADYSRRNKGRRETEPRYRRRRKKPPQRQ